MNPIIPNSKDKSLKKGTIKLACIGRFLKSNTNQLLNNSHASLLLITETEIAKYTAAKKPIKDCQKNFHRAESPFEFFNVTCRVARGGRSSFDAYVLTILSFFLQN